MKNLLPICLLVLLSNCSPEPKVVTEKEMMDIRERNATVHQMNRLPDDAKLIRVLPCRHVSEYSEYSQWVVIELHGNTYLYRYYYNGNGTTEVMVPYVEKVETNG